MLEKKVFVRSFLQEGIKKLTSKDYDEKIKGLHMIEALIKDDELSEEEIEGIKKILKHNLIYNVDTICFYIDCISQGIKV